MSVQWHFILSKHNELVSCSSVGMYFMLYFGVCLRLHVDSRIRMRIRLVS